MRLQAISSIDRTNFGKVYTDTECRSGFQPDNKLRQANA